MGSGGERRAAAHRSVAGPEHGVTSTDPVVASFEGRELEVLDSMMGALLPKAREGDGDSIDRALKLLALRLQYRRQRLAEEG